MAVLEWCCCSLLSTAISLGFTSAFLYGVSFAIELWWIIEAEVSLSVPAYVLAASYLLLCVLSTTMLLSLRSKVPRLLLAWLLLTVLAIFPEAGLVLFMAIYHWAGGTYGVIEISLWLVRVFFNVCGIVCIQSLWSRWREEESIFQSLHELSLSHSGLGSSPLGLAGHHKLRSSIRQPPLHPRFMPPSLNNNHLHHLGAGATTNYGHNIAYNNPAFSTSTLQLNTNKFRGSQVARSTSSASHLGSLPSLAVAPPYLQQGFSKNEFNPQMFLAPHRPVSQYDLPSFGLDPDAPVFLPPTHGQGGLQATLPINVYHGASRRELGETMAWYRPRSLGSLAAGQEGRGAQLSERWTTGRKGEYDTQSLDRRLARPGAGGAFMGATGYPSEGGRHTLGQAGGSRHSLGQASGLSMDSPDKYRDIAL